MFKYGTYILWDILARIHSFFCTNFFCTNGQKYVCLGVLSWIYIIRPKDDDTQNFFKYLKWIYPIRHTYSPPSMPMWPFSKPFFGSLAIKKMWLKLFFEKFAWLISRPILVYSPWIHVSFKMWLSCLNWHRIGIS